MAIATKVRSAVFGELSALTTQKEKDEKEADRLRALIRENEADYCAGAELAPVSRHQLEERAAEWDPECKRLGQ